MKMNELKRLVRYIPKDSVNPRWALATSESLKDLQIGREISEKEVMGGWQAVFEKSIMQTQDPIMQPTTKQDRWFNDPLVQANILQNCERLLPPLPVSPPPAIFCIGFNYSDHAKEVNAAIPTYPVLCMKNPAAALGAEANIHISGLLNADPSQYKSDLRVVKQTHETTTPVQKTLSDASTKSLERYHIDIEVELAVVIGKACKDIKPDEVSNHILGYTIANDVTARKWQGPIGGGQWCYSKSFDGFCPLGPYLLLQCKEFDPSNLKLSSQIRYSNNPEPIKLQDNSTANMIFSIPTLISFLSQSMTLLPGTVILTGTPSGAGFARTPPVYISKGDVAEIEIENLGILRNEFV